ncbi:MAG: YncE family protein [Gemmatimonadaceae bacterium]
MKPAALLLALLALLAGCEDDDPSGPGQQPERYEVWLVDQSNATGLAYGGKIYIYADTALSATAAPSPSVIDLSVETAALCFASTGANPTRPHMLFFNTAQTHAVLSFVASGHVVIFNAATRAPLACLQTSAGAGGFRQAHAAVPSADGSYIAVANQNGKLLERINTNYSSNTFTLDAAATLNLATCTTPSGTGCELTGLRPDNAPICPVIENASTRTFVTLRGGGLFVVDAKATPMKIIAAYDASVIHPNGCGGIQVGGNMYINSGGGTASNLSEFDVYSFTLSSFAATNAPNTPARTVLFSDDATPNRDSHGMTVSEDGRYLWVGDRGTNVAEIFDLTSGARLTPVNLAGAQSSDPAPDLADISPDGDFIFFALRGPNPLTGDPAVSTGNTPGLGIVEVTQDGRSGSLVQVVRITNLDVGSVERADAHGVRVRLR